MKKRKGFKRLYPLATAGLNISLPWFAPGVGPGRAIFDSEINAGKTVSFYLGATKMVLKTSLKG